MVGRLLSFWNGQFSSAMVVSRRVYHWFYRQWQVWCFFSMKCEVYPFWGEKHKHILYMRWCHLLIVGIGSLNNTIGFENKLGDPDCQICTPMLKFRRFNMVCVLYSHKRNFPAGPCQIPHWMFQYPGLGENCGIMTCRIYPDPREPSLYQSKGENRKKKRAMTHKCRLVVGGCVWSFPGVPFFFFE